MVLTKILLRSYKSFNYDYKLKYKHESADYPDCKAPYEDEIDFDSWRPWVNIPVRSPIACIVGANESGKSHLVSSVYKVLSLEPARRDDICRYSVDMELGTKGDFIVGLQFENLSSELQDFLHTLTPKKETLPTESASNDTDETLNAAITKPFKSNRS